MQTPRHASGLLEESCRDSFFLVSLLEVVREREKNKIRIRIK